MELKQKGTQATIGAFKKLNVSLIWSSAVDLDLMAFYKTKDGRVGGIYSDHYAGGFLGDLNRFPFIQLSGDAGVGAVAGDNREELRITRLDDFEALYIVAINFTDASSKIHKVFADYDAQVEIVTDRGNNYTVALDSTQSGSVAILCQFTSTFIGSSLVNNSDVMSFKELTSNVPGASAIQLASKGEKLGIAMRDIESLRFGYESELLKVITAQLGSELSFTYDKAKNMLDMRRKELLGDAVRVTADLLPEVHEVYQSCLDIIGGDLNGNLFICQSKEYNSNVFAHGKTFDVLIHSALLNDFSTDELRFVFGHELGHVVFEHSRFLIYDILSNVEGISADTADILFRWSRAAELSADRVGLLCCGKLPPAITALFRTASGLSGINVDQILHSFRKQYEELKTQITQVNDPHSWVRSHPMIPIRFKALELAALDIVSLRKQSSSFSWKGFRIIDQQIANLLKSLDVYGG